MPDESDGSLSEEDLWDLTKDEDDNVKAGAFFQLAVRASEKSDWNTALVPAGTARQLYSKLGDENNEGRAAYTEGHMYFNLERFAEALEAFQTAAERYRISATEEMLADAVKSVAVCFENLKDFDSASLNYLSAINIYEANKLYTAAGIASLDFGDLQGGNGQQSKALETFEDSLRIFQLGGDIIGSGRSHDRIAAAQIDLGHLDDALEHLREAHNIFEYIRDESRLIYAKYRLGWTLVMKEQWLDAVPLLREASEGYKSKTWFLQAANSDSQLAHALSNLGQEEEAVALYQSTRSVYEAGGDFKNALIADGNAATRIAAVNPHNAAVMLRRIVAGARELDDQWIVRVMSTRLAEALKKVDTDESNAEGLEVLLGITEEDWGEELKERVRYLAALGEALIENNRDGEAREAFEKVVSYGYESGFLAESARAYASLAFLENEENNKDKSNEFVAQAIAYYLAAGEDEKARNLSRNLLPSSMSKSDVIQADGSPTE